MFQASSDAGEKHIHYNVIISFIFHFTYLLSVVSVKCQTSDTNELLLKNAMGVYPPKKYAIGKVFVYRDFISDSIVLYLQTKSFLPW